MAYDVGQLPAQHQAKPFLRLQVFGSGGHRVEVPLASESDRALHGGTLDVHPGHVLQTKAYTLTLFVPAGSSLPISSATLSVNGEETRFVRVGSICSQLCKGSDIYEGYELEQKRKESRPFGLICGYARMGLEVFNTAGDRIASYISKDVACQQDDPISMENIEGMIDALTGDPERDEALRWMTGDSSLDHEGSYSLMEGGYSRGASRSVPTYLAIIEAGLSAIESALPFLRSHAANRVQREETVVDSGQVRKLGSREMRWLASHPDELRPTSSQVGSVSISGRRYAPARMSSVKAVRSFDVYENRVCLAFLDAVISSLSDFEEKVRRGQGAVNPFRAGGDETSDPSKILVVAVARALHGKQRAHIEKAARLRARALRLANVFSQITPGVKLQSLASMKLMRTKTFKEIRAYSQIYPHVERFCSYGESVPGEDELAIASLRLDRAYETYVLYRLLNWLSSRGFAPAAVEKPVYAGSYGYTSAVFADKPHVCNVYHLSRGSVRVDLFYEPVVAFGDVVSNGMTLRRMRKGKRDVYTPDFVLVVTRDDSGKVSRRSFVIDAKYRRRYNVLHPYDEADASEYDRCISQYLTNVVDIESWRLPDALWLVCGRDDEDPQIMEIDTVPWRSRQDDAFPSGIALLTPSYDITPLFEDMGLAERSLPPVKEEKADHPPSETQRRITPDFSDESRRRGDKPSSSEPASDDLEEVVQDVPLAEAKPDVGTGEAKAEAAAAGSIGLPGAEKEPFSDPTVGLDAPETGVTADEGGENPDLASEGDPAGGEMPEANRPVAPPAVAEPLIVIIESDLFEAHDHGDVSGKVADAELSLGDAAPEKKPLASDRPEQTGRNEEPKGRPDLSPEPTLEGKTGKEKAAKADAAGKKKAKNAPDEKKASSAKGKSFAGGLSDDVLEMIRRICEATVEKETLLDAGCAQGNFGFPHPLLRRTLPSSGREAKLYTKNRIDVHDGSYHVYSRWRPDNIKRLERTLAAAEKSLEVSRPALSDLGVVSLGAGSDGRGSGDQMPRVASIIVEIFEATPERARETYFDAQKCQRDIGLSKPLLKKKGDRGYLPLPGHEGVFYHQSKLPTYEKILERYRERLLSD